MNTQKRVYDKLFSNKPRVEKKKLKRTHKVNLNLVSQMNNYLDEYEGLRDDIYGSISDLPELGQKLERASDVLRFASTTAREYKSAIEELGLTLESVDGGQDAESVEWVLNNGIDIANQFLKIWSALEDVKQTITDTVK